jgi:hypothetical protein
MRHGNSDPPLTREQAYEASLAIAARKEADDFKKGFAEQLRLKMWCIEKAIETCQHISTDDGVVSIAESFHQFLVGK